jgi:hypothetical protein
MQERRNIPIIRINTATNDLDILKASIAKRVSRRTLPPVSSGRMLQPADEPVISSALLTVAVFAITVDRSGEAGEKERRQFRPPLD